jgi:hypothetical protein
MKVLFQDPTFSLQLLEQYQRRIIKEQTSENVCQPLTGLRKGILKAGIVNG